jgi:hypothetical protein
MSKPTATQTDCFLDLVAILDEALDSGRLFGGDGITIERVEEIGDRNRTLRLVLSSDEVVEINVYLRYSWQQRKS